MKIKKTAKKIENDILSCLSLGPKTISELKHNINSNWITVEKFLKKLNKEKKVKEIISTNKKRVYQLSYPETYFEIPITIEEKNKFNTLYNLILSEYKSIKKIPTKTEFAKVAVDVISEHSELKKLPTIWYLYGIIPLMAAEPDKEYFKEFEFKDENKMKKIIIKSINDKKGKSCITIQKEQHKKYNEKLYIYCDEFVSLTKNKWDKDKILKNLNKIYISCPIDEKFPIFDFFDRFNSILRKLFFLEIEQECYERETITTFDALWKYLATYNAYKSIKRLNRIKDPIDILRFYMGNIIESREMSLEESLSNINSIYLNNLGENIKLKTSKEIDDIRNTLDDLY